MAGQGIDRRDVIRMIGMASVAAAFPGFRLWTFACSHETSTQDQASRTGAFQPQFFSPEEFQLVERLTDLIIPADDGPGARDAGVAEFIDFMVVNDIGVPGHFQNSRRGQPRAGGIILRDRFRTGLNWMNARCQWLYGRPFLKCSAEQQDDLLEHLAYKDRHRPTEGDGRAFFQMMRDYTVMGFYTSKIGLEQLGFPGLQTAWAAMPGCAHPGDPEHLRLPPPG